MSFHFVVCAGPVGRETARLLGEEGQFGMEAPKILSFSPGVRGVVSRRTLFDGGLSRLFDVVPGSGSPAL